MFVCNATKQHWELVFREPRNGLLVSRFIPSGQQIELGTQWTVEEQSKVIQHLERFGCRDRAELSRLAGFVGYLYSDTAIDTDAIYSAHEKVVDTQEQRAAAAATNAALAFDYTSRRPSGRPGAHITEVEVVEMPDPYGNVSKDPVAFSLTTDPDGRTDVRLPQLPTAA